MCSQKKLVFLPLQNLKLSHTERQGTSKHKVWQAMKEVNRAAHIEKSRDPVWVAPLRKWNLCWPDLWEMGQSWSQDHVQRFKVSEYLGIFQNLQKEWESGNQMICGIRLSWRSHQGLALQGGPGQESSVDLQHREVYNYSQPWRSMMWLTLFLGKVIPAPVQK